MPKAKANTVAERIAERLFEDGQTRTPVDRLIQVYDLHKSAVEHFGEVSDHGKRIVIRGGWCKESVIRIITEELARAGEGRGK